MLSRSSSKSKVQIMSKSEYYRAKNIPDADPLKKLNPERNLQSDLVPITTLSFPKSSTISLEHTTKHTIRNNDENLSKQLRINALEIDNLKVEIERLTIQLRNSYEEKENLISNYEERLKKTHTENINLRSTKIQIEEKFRLLEEEKKQYEELKNNLLLDKSMLEIEIQELKRQIKENQNLNGQYNIFLTEKNFLELELKKYKVLQTNLENDLIQKTNEQTKMINTYEERINLLQNELSYYKQKGDEYLKYNTNNILVVEEENKKLKDEILILKSLNKNFEMEKSKYMNQNDESWKLKIGELENSNKSLMLQVETEKNLNDNLKMLLQSQKNEFILKEADYQKQLYSNSTKISVITNPNQNNIENDIRTMLLFIEIERLHMIIDEKLVEIEQLNDHDDLEINKIKTQHQHEIMIFEARIKNLEERSNQETQRANQISNDYTILQIQHTEIQNENTLLKIKLQDAQTQIESNTKVIMDKEITNMSIKFIEERTNLETMIMNFKLKISELETKISLLMTEVNTLHHINSEKELEIEGYKKKIVLIASEMEKLNQSIVDLKLECEKWRIKASTIESEKEPLKQRLEIELRAKIESDLSLAFTQEKTNLEFKISQLQAQISQYETKIYEIKQLQISKNEKEIEIESWKRRYEDLIKANEQQKLELKTQYESMLKSTLEIEIKNALLKYKVDESAYQSQNKANLIIIQELEEKIKMYISEIERYQINYSDKVKEIEQLKITNTQLLNEIQTWKLKFNSLESNSKTELEAYLMEFNSKMKIIIEKETHELESKLTSEKMKYENLIQKSQQKLDENQLKNLMFMIEIERLHNTLIEKQQTIEILHEKIIEIEKNQTQKTKVILEKEKEELMKKITDFELIIINIKQEKDKYSNQIIELNRVIEEWKSKYNIIQRDHDQKTQQIQIEIQSKYKIEYENQLREFTSRYINEQNQYEKQIQQLKLRINDLELKNITIAKDNETIQMDLQHKSMEINAWKEKLISIEKTHLKEIEDLKIQYENRKKMEFEMSMKEQQNKYNAEFISIETSMKSYKQKLIDYENKISTLNSDILRINKSNEDKINEIESWKIKYNQLEKNVNLHLEELRIQWEKQKQIDMDNLAKQINLKIHENKSDLSNQLAVAKAKIIEFEEKLKNIIIENEKLRNISDSSLKEIEIWKSKYAQLEIQRTSDLEKLRLTLEQEKKQYLEIEIKNYANKISIQQNENENKVKEFRQKSIELEQKNKFLANETERMTKILDEKLKEIEIWKNKFAEIQIQKENEFEEVKYQVESLKRTTISSDEYKIRFSAEKAAYETQIMQLKQKITELELMNDEKIKENQKLTQFYNERQIEIEKFKERLINDKGNTVEVENLRKELEYYKSNNSDFKDIKIKFDKDKLSYESQIIQFKQTLESNRIEIANLYEIANKRKIENEILTKQLNESKSEMQRLIKEMKNIENDCLNKTSKYEQLCRSLEEMRRSRDIYKVQLDKNNAEIALKNKELIEKIQEVDLLKSKYDNALNNMGSQILTTTRVLSFFVFL